VTRLAVAVSSEGVRTPVSAERLVRVAQLVLRAEKVTDAMISVALVGTARIAAINVKHLRHPGPTDVISFGFNRSATGPVIGDIYIAPKVASANAKRAGVGVREEMVRLVVHGVLHVLGHEHPVDSARERSPMWKRQEALVRRAMRAVKV
jgi:probable rRNA maturation factor